MIYKNNLYPIQLLKKLFEINQVFFDEDVVADGEIDVKEALK